MDNTFGTIVSYRPDIKVVDATLRDGGLVNNFGFTTEFVKDLYKTNIAAGVDYMEFGYKASKDIFDPKDFGKWKFSNEDDIREIVEDNDSDLKICVMADVGRTDYKRDIINKEDSVIDMIRVATYIHQIPTAIDMISDAKAKGYEVTVNLMAVSKVDDENLDNGLELLAKSDADCIYLVDSFGAFYPEQVRRLTARYMAEAAKYGKKIGVHAHNNQQLAFANTIEACTIGVSYLDVTMSGMGRGAGNCYTELLMGFLRNPKYRMSPVLKFIENHMVPLKKAGVVWGCDVQYMITGNANQHPRTAIAFTGEGRTDYDNFYTQITSYE